MSRVEDAIALVTSYADDDSHGYELRCRDYGVGTDCAGLVRMYAAACEGVAVSDYPDFGTWSEVSILTARGWTATEFSRAAMRRGDVLLRALGDSTGHTVVYLGDGKIVGAEGNWDGRRGDSSGNEVTVRGYYDYRYNWILRPPASCYGDARDEWVQAGDGRWWYRHADGSYTSSDWERIDGRWYLFDADGWMLTGWQQRGGSWYYLNESHDGGFGAMLTGWQLVGGKWYFLNDQHDGTFGAMVTGWREISGKWYYFTPSGAMATGWQLVDGAYYYMGEDGEMVKGWQLVDGKWYWLKEDGSMSNDEVLRINDKFYGFDETGKMLGHSLDA